MSFPKMLSAHSIITRLDLQSLAWLMTCSMYELDAAIPVFELSREDMAIIVLCAIPYYSKYNAALGLMTAVSIDFQFNM